MEILKTLRTLLIGTIALGLNAAAFAQTNSVVNIAQLSTDKTLPFHTKKLQLNKRAIIPVPPKLHAKTYVLVDANNGKILATHNGDMRRPPASLTKLMTLYIISSAVQQGRIKVDDKVRISENAWRIGGSRMFVKLGSTVSVKDLIHGIIVASGNDACVAMAEHIAGNEHSFSDLMNQQAKLLGMKNSHFTDSTGMPHPNHYTTAHDLAILSAALIRDFPEDYKWYKQKWFTWNGIKQPNRNRLLWRNHLVDGLKTGHTKEAGYCLVASAKNSGTRLISVVMGEPSDSLRAADSQALLTYGFRNFESRRLFKAGDPVNNIRIWMGEEKFLPAGVGKDMYVTIPTGTAQDLEATMVLDEQLKAPITRGQKIGHIDVTLDKQPIGKQNLYALKDVARGGWWSLIRDKAHLAIKGWLGLDTKEQKASTNATSATKTKS